MYDRVCGKSPYVGHGLDGQRIIGLANRIPGCFWLWYVMIAFYVCDVLALFLLFLMLQGNKALAWRLISRRTEATIPTTLVWPEMSAWRAFPLTLSKIWRWPEHTRAMQAYLCTLRQMCSLLYRGRVRSFRRSGTLSGAYLVFEWAGWRRIAAVRAILYVSANRTCDLCAFCGLLLHRPCVVPGIIDTW